MAIFPIHKRPSEMRKWDPFEEISRLNERVNHIFDRFLSAETTSLESSWLPALDVVENEKTLTLKIDVPGMESKDLNVHIEDDVLVIKGERKSEVEEKKDNFLHIERGYGAFMRSYPLPDYADRESIKASCKDGVLTVELAKVPAKQKDVKKVIIA